MHHFRRWACVFVCLAGASAAFAERGDLQFESPSSALRCLTSQLPQRAKPDYPPLALSLARSAVVRVRLRFDAADKEPSTTVTFNNADVSFAEAVKAFVTDYRLPCMEVSARAVEAVQEFQFVASGPAPVVFWNPPRNSASYFETMPSDCKAVVQNYKPPYHPGQGLGPSGDGNVIVEITFTSADAEPKMVVVYSSGDRFTVAVRSAVRSYRLPCLTPADAPLTARRQFVFSVEGDPSSMIDNLSIGQLVSVVHGLASERVRFDFTTMGCPFAIKLGLYRPYATNEVGEVGRADPNRREFIEWLRTVTLDIPKSAAQFAVGHEFTVDVPCAVLDLL